MICTKCGQQLADNAVFCTACGNKVETPVNPAPQPVYEQPTYEQPVYAQPAAPQQTNVQQEKPAKKPVDNKKIIKLACIAAAALLFVVVALVVVINVVKKNQRTNPIFMIREGNLVFKESAEDKKMYTIKENISASYSAVVNNIIYDKKHNVIYFFDNNDSYYDTATLYAANIKKVKKHKSDAVEKINADVCFSAFVTEFNQLETVLTNTYCPNSGAIIYARRDGNDTELFYYNKGEKIKISDKCSRYAANSSGNRIVLSVNDDDGLTLKIATLSKGSFEFDTVASEGFIKNGCKVANDTKTVTYVVEDDYYKICTYDGKEKKTLVSDITAIKTIGNYYVYTKDDEDNIFKFNVTNKKEVKTSITDARLGDIYFYANGKIIAFENEDDGLSVALEDKKPGEVGEDIDEMVVNQDGTVCFFYNDDDEAIYCGKIGSGKVDSKKIYTVDREADFSLYGNTLYIMEKDGNEYTIYKSEGGNASLVAKNVYANGAFGIYNNGSILYTDRDKDAVYLKFKKKLHKLGERGDISTALYAGHNKLLYVNGSKLFVVNCKNGKKTIVTNGISNVAFPLNYQ